MSLSNVLQKIEIIILGAIGGVLSYLIINLSHHDAPAVAAVDVAGIVNKYVIAAGKKVKNQDDIQKNVQEFGKKLDYTLREIEHEKNIILMPKQALVTGGHDITKEVIARIGLNNE